jgi:hypothetical protein
MQAAVGFPWSATTWYFTHVRFTAGGAAVGGDRSASATGAAIAMIMTATIAPVSPTAAR